MNWTAFPWGAVLTFATLFSAVVLLAMDERNRRKFAVKSDVHTSDGRYRFLTREDATGMSQRLDQAIQELDRRIERNAGLFVSLDDRTGNLEEKTALIAERQTQQWERISEQMARTSATLQTVTEEQKEIGRMLQDLALRLERLHRHEGERS